MQQSDQKDLLTLPQLHPIQILDPQTKKKENK